MFDDFFGEDENDDADSGSAAVESEEPQGLPSPRDNPDLVGHEKIEQTILSHFNDNRLPHAMIFSGPMGVGKATAAFRIARFLLKHGAHDAGQDSLFGDAPPAPQSLYVAPDDPVFKRVASGGHPDLRYFDRPVDEKKGTKKGVVDIDTIRKIAPFLRMSASDGGWRIAIVDEAETMNRYAQNALLKILEEPPANALLILVCNRPGALIPTIRSRCRLYHFASLGSSDMSVLLKRAAPDAAQADLALLANLSDGSPGRALLLHEDGGINNLKTVLAFLEDWEKPDWAKIHQMADSLSRSDAEKAYDGFAFVMEWVAQNFLKIKAMPSFIAPDILTAPPLRGLCAHNSLEQWAEICEKLTEHFKAIDIGNLDRKHGVLGGFAILAGKK